MSKKKKDNKASDLEKEKTKSENQKDTKSVKKDSNKNAFKRIPAWIILAIVVVLLGLVALILYQTDNTETEPAEAPVTFEQLVEESDRMMLAGDDLGAYALWENAIASTDDPNEKDDLYMELSRVYLNFDDVQKAYDTVILIPELNSDISDYSLYATLSYLATEVGEKELAIEYTEKLIASLDQTSIDYELELANYQSQLEELKK